MKGSIERWSSDCGLNKDCMSAHILISLPKTTRRGFNFHVLENGFYSPAALSTLPLGRNVNWVIFIYCIFESTSLLFDCLMITFSWFIDLLCVVYYAIDCKYNMHAYKMQCNNIQNHKKLNKYIITIYTQL